MKTIVIARHAKSDWATGLSDHDRPLNARGRQDAPRMGQALHELQFLPDLILTSSAVRARTTAEAVAKELNYHQPIRVEQALYEAGHGLILSMLQALPDKVDRVMVFGHNPILEQLAGYLLQMRAAVVMPTSGMICIEANIREWSKLEPGATNLKWFLIPKLLA